MNHPLHHPSTEDSPLSLSLRESFEAIQEHLSGVRVVPPTPQHWRQAMSREDAAITLLQTADLRHRYDDFKEMLEYVQKNKVLSSKGVHQLVELLFCHSGPATPSRALLINAYPEAVGSEQISKFFIQSQWSDSAHAESPLLINPRPEWSEMVKRVLIHVLENSTIPWDEKIKSCRRYQERGWDIDHAGDLSHMSLISGVPHLLLCRFRPSPELSDLRQLLDLGVSFEAKDKYGRTVENALDDLCRIFATHNQNDQSVYMQYILTRQMKEDLCLRDELQSRLSGVSPSTKRKI